MYSVSAVARQRSLRPALESSRLQNVPGRDPVAPIRCRVGRLQRGGDGLADRVVQDEPVRIGLDEGQAAKPVECEIGVVSVEHGGEKRSRGSPDDRRGVECPPGLAVEPREVDARQLVDDGAGRERLEVEVGAVRERGGREAQRERVAASDPVDAGGVGRRDAGAAQQLLGLVAAEVAERQRLEQLAERRRPRRDRLVATGKQEPGGVGTLGSSTWRIQSSSSARAS